MLRTSILPAAKAPQKKKAHAQKRGLPIVCEVLPLADGDVALAVDHIVNIYAGEKALHIRYPLLSLFRLMPV